VGSIKPWLTKENDSDNVMLFIGIGVIMVTMVLLFASV